ncbi:MAG: pyridoxamine 5'-phosphate oxidase family protein [Propionibacteriaceae bacterium]|nr:pyridoxamine 5'-phosphate oxidase family protein [Propionibacteriaceae bacterium]
MDEPLDTRARFESLGDDEMADLLRTHQVGRIAWESHSGPAILPVAYAWCEGLIAFRTADWGLLAELATPTDVAFQIDEFEVDTASGWAVMLRAVTKAVTKPEEVVCWQRLLPVPWAPGSRELIIRLTPRSASGRVVVRGPEKSAPGAD